MNNDQKTTKIIRAAELFYEQRKSQIEIARILNCSAATVSRMLSEALDSGIVQVVIRRPIEKNPALAEELGRYLSLEEIIVVTDGTSQEQAYQNVGYATAEFLSNIIFPNAVIGISWGVTLSYVVRNLSEFTYNSKGVEVIQLMGGLGSSDPNIDGPELAQKMAGKLGGKYSYIQAPVVLETPTLTRQIMNEVNIKKVVERASHADIVISSVSSLIDDYSSIVRAGFIKKNELSVYAATGAVGHLFARLIDENGCEIEHDFNERVVAVSLDSIKNARWKIGIVANTIKAKAVIAAVRGNLYNTLIIDESSALEIINIFKEKIKK